MMILMIGACILSLILMPREATQGAIDGIRLCGSSLIPALLPFLIFTRMLSSKLMEKGAGKKIHGISTNHMLPFLLSFIGGYPAGIATTVSLYTEGKISKQEVQKLIPYCNNSGPGFFIAVLGVGLFSDIQKGLCLYGIHVCASLMVFALCYNRDLVVGNVRIRYTKAQESFPLVFQKSLNEACTTMVRVCGLVILFCVIRKMLSCVLPSILLPYMGLLELSSGLLTTGNEDFVLWSVFMGWGGLCVHMQAMSIWQEAGLKIKGYFRNKLLHGALSGLLALGFMKRNWMVLGSMVIFCGVFFVFRQNWGSKKQKNRL